MKKIISGASLIALMIGSYSCNKVVSPSTFEFDIITADWSPSGTSGTSNYVYYATHSIAEISDAVVSNGAVLGYVKTGTYWAALPFTETYSTYMVNYNYSYTKGEVLIIRKDSDLLTSNPAVTITIKIVVLTEKNMPLIEGIDVNNYEEVANALHLEKE